MTRNGRWTYLYRAVDQYGQVIDVWLSARRDLATARIFFTRVLTTGSLPVEVTTDRAAAYSRGHCCVARSGPAGDWCDEFVLSLPVRWFPVSSRGDLARGALYLRYGLSYRDVEELLAERGVTVDHVSVYRWVQRFTSEFVEAAVKSTEVVDEDGTT